MPNWCYNNLEISGPEESLKKFYDLTLENAQKRVKEVESDTFFRTSREDFLSLLETFIPVSDYFQSMEGFNNGGHEWCMRNWGCKWSEKLLSSFFQKEEWELQFETPWIPPLTGYLTISRIFPDLMFLHYFEDEGMCFAGAHVYQNGIIIYSYEENDFSSFFPEYDEESYDENLENMRKMFIEDARRSFTLFI